jgi:UDP-N-acetyl-D-mannosaminuronate dehydrogenase
VLVLGVAFKPDIEDARNSPAERIIELLLQGGAEVRYHDPYVPRFRVGQNPLHRQPLELASVPLTAGAISRSDVVVIATGHSGIDYDWVVQHAALVIDPVNVTGSTTDPKNIVRLGAPAQGQPSRLPAVTQQPRRHHEQKETREDESEGAAARGIAASDTAD